MEPPLESRVVPSFAALVRNSRLQGYALAIVLVCLDQGSKLWLVRHLMADGPRVIEVFPFVNLVMIWNRGISFGIFGTGTVSPWLFFGGAVVLAAALGVGVWRAPNRIVCYGLGMMIGGALGNAMDRLRWGAVADFLDVHALGWHFWAFNLADAAISIGAVLLVFDSVFRRSS